MGTRGLRLTKVTHLQMWTELFSVCFDQDQSVLLLGLLFGLLDLGLLALLALIGRRLLRRLLRRFLLQTDVLGLLGQFELSVQKLLLPLLLLDLPLESLLATHFVLLQQLLIALLIRQFAIDALDQIRLILKRISLRAQIIAMVHFAGDTKVALSEDASSSRLTRRS